MRPISLLVLLILALAGAVNAGTTTPQNSDRIEVLTDYHGYFPCMDCHEDQEPVTTPRILDEEHLEPLEWEDDEGVIHFVSFGQKVPISDLIGSDEPGSLADDNLARIGVRLNISSYMDDQGLAPTDSVWTLVHGGGNLWCLDCHHTVDRDKLVKLNQELLSFNESHLLCGECHGPKLRDWEKGIHGKTTGYWDLALDQESVSIRKLCVECHSPHNPSFPGLIPEPAPIARVDGPASHHPSGDGHPSTSDQEGSH